MMDKTNRTTIAQLRQMRESEDHVEFKCADMGNFSYNGADKGKPADRRKCILGYVVALCNEGGGLLVLGMHDTHPHKVVGTKQCENAIGDLESRIYNDLGIRPDVYELYEDEKERAGRVLVIQVPERPKGKVYKFDDVPLMRVGEDLMPMDDKTFLSIIQEQEPDFSEQTCREATFGDLDPKAIARLKEQYARKQKNPQFASLSDRQALSDLKLIREDKITNAAVLLVGKEEVITSLFPNAKVMLEYRHTLPQIPFDNRQEFKGPFFLLIDRLWEAVNLRNGNYPVREGAYIFDIPFFNEDVIRESINNAFAHRDYRINSEIVIRQYPTSIAIVNAGGFPVGVTKENILTVQSTPRNRLLADVLAKTGVVERSGQGVDKIFLNTISEGKAHPDYSRSDDFQVVLILSGQVENQGFATFIKMAQDELPKDGKLSVFDVLSLDAMRKGERENIDKETAHKLLHLGLVERRGKTNATYYILSRQYYELTNNLTEYSSLTDWDKEQVWAVLCPYLEKYKVAKMGDIAQIVGNHLSRKQLRNFIEQFKTTGFLLQNGDKNTATYSLGANYFADKDLKSRALALGLQELRRDDQDDKETKGTIKGTINATEKDNSKERHPENAINQCVPPISKGTIKGAISPSKSADLASTVSQIADNQG